MSILPSGMIILIIVSLLLCCIGFKRFVWFMSVGYGLSTAGIGATLLIMSLLRQNYSAIYLVQCIVIIVYGIRLGGFLLFRELKNESYRQKSREVGGDTTVPVFVAAVMWICCGLLYIMQNASPIYRLLNGTGNTVNIALYIGTFISIIGIYIEAAADSQKSEAKKINPNMPAMNGLYKYCRCPNYFGEMLFWTGNIITGIGALAGIGQWIIGLAGYIIIIYVMMSGAKRVEGRHIKHYGNNEAYIEYSNTVPLIIPFIPLYHMTTLEEVNAKEAKKGKSK